MTAGQRPGEKLALDNVRVFDGRMLTPPQTVVIDGPLLSADQYGAKHQDGGGGVLVAGFIDAHVHLHDAFSLEQLSRWGVTTALDMATWPPQRLAALRSIRGGTDIRSAGTPVIGPGGPHARIPGLATEAVISDPADAEEFVRKRVAEGSDYIKVVLESPGEGGPDRDVVAALAHCAHSAGKKLVAHATSNGAYAMALDVGADVVTHIPLGQPIGDDMAQKFAAAGSAIVPTLVMMEGTAGARGASMAFAGATQSVGSLYGAGVLLLAGTDANATPGVPFSPTFGRSLHRELELLVAAGLSTAAALRAATSATAEYFGLNDRGTIEPGRRADVVLIDGDPISDITATKNLVRAWCAGVEQEVVAA